MDKLLAFISAALLTVGACSSCAKAPQVEKFKPYDPTLAIFTAYSFGHGCPIKDMGILTALHVVQPRLGYRLSSATWSDASGQVGYADPIGPLPFADIAFLMPVGRAVPTYLPIGKANVGDRVYYWEFSYINRAEALRAEMKPATLLRKVGGHLIVDNPPDEGASGSCIVNASGEVVGVVVWGMVMNDGRTIGIGVEIPEEY
jgi:hypothetical protein